MFLFEAIVREKARKLDTETAVHFTPEGDRASALRP
jgi:hypothetical protein